MIESILTVIFAVSSVVIVWFAITHELIENHAPQDKERDYEGV